MSTATLMSFVLSLALSGFLLGAVVTDLVRLRIPNAITLGVAGLFLVKAMLGLADGPVILHVAIGGVVLLVGFAAFALRIIGGGDAKLIAALALWFGPQDVAGFLAMTGIVGGGLALLLILVRRMVVITIPAGDMGSLPPPYSLLDPKAPLPYAVPIAFAALWLIWL